MATSKDFSHKECSAQFIPQCCSRPKTNYNGIFSGRFVNICPETVHDKKIFFITEDQPLSFLLKTVYMLMDRNLTILAVLLFQIKKLGYREVT